MTKKYYAHSKENQHPINWQPLDEHLKNVAEMADPLLKLLALGIGDILRACGMLWEGR